MIKNLSIVVVLIAASFFLLYDAPASFTDQRSMKELWNLGHMVYFGLFTYLLTQLPGFKRQSLFRRWSLSLGLVLLIGLFIEVLQFNTSRTPDIEDLYKNLTGALLVLAFLPATSEVLSTRWKVTLRFVVAVVFSIQLLPLSLALLDESNARAQFPVLANFDTALELDRWQGDAAISRIRLDENKDAYQLKVSLSTAQYSGTGMKYFPSDWSGFNTVAMRFYQPLEESLKLTVRIHDVTHNNQFNDRFNKSFVLGKGWTDLSISLDEVRAAPSSRPMDLKRVSDISFFAIKLPRPREVFLDSVYLSNQ